MVTMYLISVGVMAGYVTVGDPGTSGSDVEHPSSTPHVIGTTL